ncbi:MAG TPA: hypothetical protein VF652_10410 [Allosphingosinicella sp.]
MYPVLSAVTDDNGWMFVRGMTGADSFDPVGPAATSDKLTFKDGDHYVGANISTPSSAIFRTFFDGPDAPWDTGYVVTIDAYCFDEPFDISQLPAFQRQARYVVGKNRVLDFMGPFDTRIRFGNPLPTARVVDGPLYPFNAFLGSPIDDFSTVFWHPMPNGSVRRRTGWIPLPQDRPLSLPQTALPARAASARAVVRPFMMVASDLSEICKTEFAAFADLVPAVQVDGQSLFQTVQQIYAEQLQEALPKIVDTTAAGEYLILLTDDYSAIIVLRQPKVQGAYPIRIWEVDHDSFERVQHQVANRTLLGLGAQRNLQGQRFSDRNQPVIQMQGRGSRPLEGPDRLGMMTDRPTFSLDYQATLVQWRQPPRTRNEPDSSPIPHSTVAVRFDWVYDPFGESFDLVVNAPRLVDAIPPIREFWERYQDGMVRQAQGDSPDLTPFTLAGAPWLDDAPRAPNQPPVNFQG